MSLTSDAVELEHKLSEILVALTPSLNRNQLGMLGAALTKMAAEVAVIQKLPREHYLFFAERAYDQATVAVSQKDEHP